MCKDQPCYPSFRSAQVIPHEHIKSKYTASNPLKYYHLTKVIIQSIGVLSLIYQPNTCFTNHLSINYSVQSEMTVEESNAAETLSKHVCSYSLCFSVKDMTV